MADPADVIFIRDRLQEEVIAVFRRRQRKVQVIPGCVDLVPFLVQLHEIPGMLFRFLRGGAGISRDHNTVDACPLQQVFISQGIPVTERTPGIAPAVFHQRTVCGVCVVIFIRICVVPGAVDQKIVDLQRNACVGLCEINLFQYCICGLFQTCLLIQINTSAVFTACVLTG